MCMRTPSVLVGVFVAGLGLACAVASAAGEAGSLADALRIIQSKQYVDLTHSFSPMSPVWRGFGQATRSAASDPKTHRPYTIKEDGFRATFYSLVGQYGTHIDPPAHFSAED
jgi:Putative cyclase